MRLGMDFGTTRVVVAFVDRGNYPVVSFDSPDGTAREWFPPLVAVQADQRAYGWEAWAKQEEAGWTIVRSLKRTLEASGPETQVQLAGQVVPMLQLLREMVGALKVDLLRTRLRVASVLKELVGLAEQSWQVFDPDAILTALRQREEMGSTALASGVAIPHPRRPLPAALGESVLAYGRTASGIPFGAPHGNLTDVFFLVCCRDDRTHIRVLARLSRLLLRPGFVDELRAAETPAETWQLIEAAERELSPA